jgi:DNA polymerase-3 subunit alpha
MEKFWRQLEEFAAYCFNKAHAACYALIAYQTAYLKANYPAAFMAALMTSDFDNTDRLAIEITECKHMGIDVLQPDINESFVEFAVVPGEKQIRFGLAAIKNVGTAAVEEILRARGEERFANLEDFFARVSSRIVNKKTLESLIKAGAFDGMEKRHTLLHNLDVLVAYGGRLQRQAQTGQVDLFGAQADEVALQHSLVLEVPTEDSDTRQQLAWERELLGIYLSQHPLEAFEHLLAEQAVAIPELQVEHDNKTVSVGGSIADIREITTKNGQKMAFIKLADRFGEVELVLFPGIYQQTTGIWERDRVILAKGKVSAKDRNGNTSAELKVLVDDAREITPQQAAAYEPTGKKPKIPKKTSTKHNDKNLHSSVVPSRLYLRMDAGNDHQLLLSLKQLIDENTGETEVVLVLGEDSSKQVIRLPARIRTEEKLLSAIKQLIGADNVKLV